MRFLALLFLPLPFLLGCSSDDASPKNAVPANSATVKIDGVAIPLDVSRSEAFLEESTGDFYVYLNTSQTTGPRLLLEFANFQKRPYKITQDWTSFNRIDFESPNGGQYYASRGCNPVRREMEILTYDEARGTVSGRFSGTMCAGFGAQADKPSKTATDGTFNLSFRVQ